MRRLCLVGSGPVGSGRARVVEFSYNVTTATDDGCAASKMSEKVRQRVKLEFAVDSPCKDGLVLSQLERSLETDIAHKVRAASAVGYCGKPEAKELHCRRGPLNFCATPSPLMAGPMRVNIRCRSCLQQTSTVNYFAHMLSFGRIHTVTVT